MDGLSTTSHKVLGEHIYHDMVMPGIYPADILDRVPDFEFRSDDILIVTYPKSGTTWLQHITWLIMNGVDGDTSSTVALHQRSPTIHRIDHINMLPMLKSPRVIKSHLPYSFFKTAIEGEGKPRFKVIVVMRNVKDVLSSYYNFYRMSANFGNFNQGFDVFFDMFKKKKLVAGDYFDHVLSWWKERKNPNFYFVKYEDMKEDPNGGIVKLASFLERELSQHEIGRIMRESSFESMQKNPMTNMADITAYNFNVSKFICKGKVGEWKNYFTKEQKQYIDNRIKEELAKHGLEFRDE